MDKKQLLYLIHQFRKRDITEDELRILKDFVNDREISDELLDEVFAEFLIQTEGSSLSEEASDRLFSAITHHTHPVAEVKTLRPKSYNWYWGAAVAVCLMFLVFTVLKQKSDGLETASEIANLEQHTISPGSAKAIVLLEDGTTIDLESLPSDSTIFLEGYTIIKDENGLLTYVLTGEASQSKTLYNTIMTPKGGEYKLSLPDGTQIWVNAASKVKYPLTFAATSREVELEGEAFFDVKNIGSGLDKLPFIVYTGGQKLEVLGTVFNVNSYGDNIHTTLVEGSVKLSYPDLKAHYLKPSQQAKYNEVKNTVQIDKVDPFYTVAWKDGSFAFDNEDIRTVMETLARWYDVSIEYAPQVKDINFTGTISRYEQIDKVLELIELTKSLKFKVEGRRIVVMR